MSYAIIRNENYKIGQLGLIYRHNERKNTNYSNKDINKQNSIKNYSIKSINTSYQKAFKILKEQYNLKGQIKKVSNVMCELIITSDKYFFDLIGENETKRYFQMAYDFVKDYQNLGEQYIVSAKVHLDETTPHLHIVFIPVIHKFDKKSGKMIDKISCSEFWKGKDSYKKLQDSFYKCVKDNGFDLERGKSNNLEHLSTEKLKQITNYENIKYELKNNKIKEVDNTNLQMVVAQNKKLVVYTNKLKSYLTKSFKVMERADNLQAENKDLKQENYELKKENKRLKEYIEHTFEYVSLLFDFSKNSLKRLVDTFVNTLNKEKDK